MSGERKISRVDLDTLRATHSTKGLCLATLSGLAGTINVNGDAAVPVSLLLDECEASFAKDKEISTLRAQVEALREALEDAEKKFRAIEAKADLPLGATDDLDQVLAALQNSELLAVMGQEAARAALAQEGKVES